MAPDPGKGGWEPCAGKAINSSVGAITLRRLAVPIQRQTVLGYAIPVAGGRGGVSIAVSSDLYVRAAVTSIGRFSEALTKVTANFESTELSISLRMPEELPYVMGLVRQAFEKQMGA